MTDERLIATTEGAGWLPAGSSAQVWAGNDCAVPEPVILARVLLTRLVDGAPEFFCVRGDRGPDLPTVRLWRGTPPTPLAEGVAQLQRELLGCDGVPVTCVGFVRNVVPAADENYRYPTPWAHVPIFTLTLPVEPVVAGDWFTLDSGSRRDLQERHWWAIVEAYLAPAVAG